MPVITPFGLFGVTLAVIPGLLVSRAENATDFFSLQMFYFLIDFL